MAGQAEGGTSGRRVKNGKLGVFCGGGAQRSQVYLDSISSFPLFSWDIVG